MLCIFSKLYSSPGRAVSLGSSCKVSKIMYSLSQLLPPGSHARATPEGQTLEPATPLPRAPLAAAAADVGGGGGARPQRRRAGPCAPRRPSSRGVGRQLGGAWSGGGGAARGRRGAGREELRGGRRAARGQEARRFLRAAAARVPGDGDGPPGPWRRSWWRGSDALCAGFLEATSSRRNQGGRLGCWQGGPDLGPTGPDLG